MKLYYILTLLTFCIFLITCQSEFSLITSLEIGPSGAGQALDRWAFARAYPYGKIPEKKLEAAFIQRKLDALARNTTYDEEWESLGPKNIGGRTLTLAFHPDDPDIIFAGSASGGLWKSTTAGAGVDAWERVSTGFPVLGVPAIAIDPNDGNVMYIGTGEVYGSLAASPGIVSRFTRGTYGIGILKTTDGGQSWSKSLDWNLEDLNGVSEIEINPLNSNTVFAATRRGLYRSYNAGETWTRVSTFTFAVDLEINPLDTNVLVVTHGNLFNPFSGIYRSTNSGDTSIIIPDLPAGFTGKALLDVSPSNPKVLYASIFNLFNSGTNSGLGLYRSNNFGETWSQVNSTDVASFQGWYAHDVAIKNDDEDSFLWGGIDIYKSTDAGATLQRKTVWQNWFFGQVPIGGPEGPGNYVHADIHKIVYHPTDPETVFAATDGGIFVSFDNGENWEGRNGSYQTQQFYANFSNSTTDSLFAMGGMQDNATAIYTGDEAWTRVLGGDGMNTAINPNDDNIIYGSSQLLTITRSNNRGLNFSPLPEVAPFGEFKAFNSPFELAPTNPNLIYAGAQFLYKSLDGGTNWAATSSLPVDAANAIVVIAISPLDENLLYVATAPDPFDFGNMLLPKLMTSLNGGQTWDSITVLPNRLISDITFHPENDQIVYVAFAGFGINHIWKTEDGGATWFTSDNGLPDVPTNSIVIDPENANNVYVGNDLGVYTSLDGGEIWEDFSNELPEAVLAMHLSISPSNRKLRVATHGNGVYQTDLIEEPVVIATKEPLITSSLNLQHYPNPAQQQITITFDLEQKARVSLKLFDSIGRLVKTLIHPQSRIGEQVVEIDLSGLNAGIYYYTLEGQSAGTGFQKSKALVKVE